MTLGDEMSRRRVRTRTVASIACAILALCGGVCAAGSAGAVPFSDPGPLEEGDVIYQVLVDRFENGDPTNDDFGDGATKPDDLGFYHGGDWKGLADRLPYIADLGVTAIWLSPVSSQEPLSRDGNEASYHGYFTKDFATPNAHFGSKEDLQSLINTAHSLGLKMILDVVPNHTADYLAAGVASYSDANYQPAAPLNNPDFYHHAGDCLFNGLESQEQIENCDLGGLDDLDQSNPAVSDYLIRTYKDWVDMGFDGIRVDAARSVPKTWLSTFEQEMGVPTFGEIFVGNVDYVADYQRYEWGALDFPYFFTVREAFAADTDMRKLSTLFNQDGKYVNANRLETFIDNHDRARFLTWADDNYQRLRTALTFEMTTRGIPVIYYGTEQADDGNGQGGEVPIANKYNRKDMTSFDENATIYKHLQRLASLKKEYPALRTGIQREMWSDENFYAFSRLDGATNSETITAATNSWDPQTRTIPVRSESQLRVGDTLVNLMNTSETVTVQAGGITGRQIVVSLEGHDAAVFSKVAPTQDYAPEQRNTTRIRVHYNAGYGHNVAIRGDRYPLSWTEGRGARNIDSDTWEFEIERIPSSQAFEFKALIDDRQWSVGQNYTGVGGQTIDVYPTFE